MIFSKELLFSDSQVVTTSAPSTNVIDLGAPGTVLKGPAALVRDIGKGEPIPIWIQFMGDAVAGADTIAVAIQVSVDEAFTSPRTVAVTPTKTGGSAGDRIPLFYIPEEADERFIRLNYTTTGAAPSYTIKAGIVLAAQSAAGVAGV